MPRDSVNRKINVGDFVVTRTANQRGTIAGRVVELTEAASCNGRVAYLSQYEGMKTDYFNCSDAHVVALADGSPIEALSTSA